MPFACGTVARGCDNRPSMGDMGDGRLAGGACSLSPFLFMFLAGATHHLVESPLRSVRDASSSLVLGIMLVANRVDSSAETLVCSRTCGRYCLVVLQKFSNLPVQRRRAGAGGGSLCYRCKAMSTALLSRPATSTRTGMPTPTPTPASTQS